MIQTECDNCKKEIDENNLIEKGDFRIFASHNTYDFCSKKCLKEFVRRL